MPRIEAGMVQRASVQHCGRPVKRLGDGVMFFFREPGPGVMAALDMVRGRARGRAAAGPRGPPCRAGRVPGGRLLRADGEHRVADRRVARPGEVLVTQAVVEASEGVGAAFTDIGPVELKGVGGTVHLMEARRN